MRISYKHYSFPHMDIEYVLHFPGLVYNVSYLNVCEKESPPYCISHQGVSLVAQLIKNLPAMQETWL